LTRYGRIINVVREKIVYEVRENNVVYAVEDVGKLPSPTPVPVTEDRSTSIRLNVEWPRAIRSLKKNLLLGTGYSSITLATDNDYLRALGEIGILGFFAFSLLFIRVVRVISKPFPYLKNFKTANLAFITGFAGALAGIFVNAFFIDIFEASKFATIFWLFVGIAVSLIYETKIEQDN
jgi:O-antigen ligase